MAEEELVLHGSMRDDGIESGLASIDVRMNSVGEAAEEMAAKTKAAGRVMESGMEQAADAAEETARSAKRATPPVKELGDEAAKTGTKARIGASGLDRFAAKARKANRQGRRFGSIMAAYKLAAVVVGFTALAGGLSAVGAGAGMALGYLAPMAGVLLGLGPLGLAAALGLWAYKAAAEGLTGPNNLLKKQFEGIGDAVARGGLASGLMDMAQQLGGLGKAVRKGMGGIGAVLGDAARRLGEWAGSVRTVDKISLLFELLAPILSNLLAVLAPLGDTLLNLLIGSIPMAHEMSESLNLMARRAAAWTQAQLESGRMQRWLLKGWRRAQTIGGALVDVIVGLYNVLRIAAGYAGDLDQSMAGTASTFRAWTESAEGQQRINRYFAESLPTLRELGLMLLGMARGLGTLGGSPNIAPLLQQIRTELGPALSDLVTKISGQGGLGPAMIDAATSIATFLAALDFSALTMFAVALASVLNSIIWLMQNVPGANAVVSALLFSFLGFKVLGPIWKLAAKGVGAFKWMRGALTMTKGLTTGQKLFAGAVKGLGSAFKWVGGLIVTIVRAIGVAFMANPIVAAIVIIIGILVLLYTECEWFRDGVHAILRFIADAAVAAWNWLSNAFKVTVDKIVEWAMWLWTNGIKPAYDAIVSGAQAAWSGIAAAWQWVVDLVVGVATWLWENGIKPVFEAIAAGAELYWSYVKFTVQVVMFVIMGIIAALAWVAEQAWKAIAAAASWVFDEVIMPLVRGFQAYWNRFTGALGKAWDAFTTALGIAWNLFYSIYLEPIINGFKIAWALAVAAVSSAWEKLTEGLAAAWRWVNETIIAPLISWISEKWTSWTTAASVLWEVFTSLLASKWQSFKDAVGDAVDWIAEKWGTFTSWLGEVFAPVGEGLTKFWSGLQEAATSVAEVATGAWNKLIDAIKSAWNWLARGWNNIPSITVPDWVPGAGGTEWSLPKLPLLWKGGPTPGGPAVVGERGPEALVRGGRVVDVLGANGPEVRNLPRGGYVVPNLSTLSALPGLARSIPPAVAAAITAGGDSPPPSGGGSGERQLLAALGALTGAVRDTRPLHVTAESGDVERAVASALRTHDRERRLRDRYGYTAGKG